MLNETLDRTMAKAHEYEILTKASKFSNVFKNLAQNKSFQDAMLEKTQDLKSKLSSDVDLIVEDPNEINVEIPRGGESLGIPFFVSLYNRLLADVA